MAVEAVHYQSIRTSFDRPKEIPDNAEIATQFLINAAGKIMVVVYNQTDKILTIDQTKSFLVNTDGQSTSYYDPTVHTSTSGSFSSETQGTSVNLGSIYNALGGGGLVSTLLGGINVSNSSTTGDYSSNTITIVDQPQINVGPHGKMIMSKEFSIIGVGSTNMRIANYVDNSYTSSPLKFSVCISYNFEDEQSKKIVTDFYVNTNLREPVTKGKVSDAFSAIYLQKPDAVAEYLYIFNIKSNLPAYSTTDEWDNFIDVNNNYSNYVRGMLINYN